MPSSLNPSFSKTVFPGAEAPKRSSPSTSPPCPTTSSWSPRAPRPGARSPRVAAPPRGACSAALRTAPCRASPRPARVLLRPRACAPRPGVPQHVAPALQLLRGTELAAVEHGHGLPRKQQRDRSVRALERDLPGDYGLLRVGGAEPPDAGEW